MNYVNITVYTKIQCHCKGQKNQERSFFKVINTINKYYIIHSIFILAYTLCTNTHSCNVGMTSCQYIKCQTNQVLII